jgi:hypothetical protein
MRGAIVSFGVVIEPNQVVLPFTRLTKADPYIDDRGSWDAGSEDGGAAVSGNIFTSSSNASTEGNVKLNTVTFQIGQELEEKTPTYREYTMEEEDFDAPPLPVWASQALDEATGIWKASKSLVMGSMGCEELEKAKANRSWLAQSSRGSRSDSHLLGVFGGPASEDGSTRQKRSSRGIKPYPSMDDSLPSQIAQLLSGFLTKDPSSLTDGYFQDLSMELRGIRASRALCTFDEIVSLTFAVLLQTILADFKSLSPQQLRTKLTAFVDMAAPLLTNFTKRILNQEVTIQFGLLQSAEICCLIGPTLAPEVLMDLPAVDYHLERALDSDNLEPILKEHLPLRDSFVLLVFLFIKNGVIELPALQKWKAERGKQATSMNSKFLEMYRYSETRIDQIIGTLQQQEEEEDDDESEEDEE